MKKFIALFALCLSTLTFAETCFQAKTPSSRFKKLPEVICIGHYGLNLVNPAAPYFEATVETSLGRMEKNISIKEVQAASGKIKISQMMIKQGDHFPCSGFDDATLNVEFEVDSNGQTIMPDLKVSVLLETNRDVCHFDTVETPVNYTEL